jgi:hypothetical protein
MESNPEDSAMKRAHVFVLCVGVAVALFAFSFLGSAVALSSAVGSGVASLNLLVLSRTVQRMVEGGGGSWALVAVVKFLVLLSTTYLLIDRGIVEPLGLALGFGALPFGILLAGTTGGTHEHGSLPPGPNASATAKTDHA